MSPTAPREARRSLTELAGAIPAPRLTDLQVIVSELVANSVRHSGLNGSSGAVEMLVQVVDSRVRVDVVDRGWGFTGGPTADTLELALLGHGGFGLYLVEALADRWGTEIGTETRVWAELSLAEG